MTAVPTPASANRASAAWIAGASGVVRRAVRARGAGTRGSLADAQRPDRTDRSRPPRPARLQQQRGGRLPERSRDADEAEAAGGMAVERGGQREPSARRGSGTTSVGRPGAGSRAIAAAAPRPAASATYRAPSSRVPASATKRSPGRTARESTASPVIRTSAPCSPPPTARPKSERAWACIQAFRRYRWSRSDSRTPPQNTAKRVTAVPRYSAQPGSASIATVRSSSPTKRPQPRTTRPRGRRARSVARGARDPPAACARPAASAPRTVR